MVMSVFTNYLFRIIHTFFAPLAGLAAAKHSAKASTESVMKILAAIVTSSRGCVLIQCSSRQTRLFIKTSHTKEWKSNPATYFVLSRKMSIFEFENKEVGINHKHGVAGLDHTNLTSARS